MPDDSDLGIYSEVPFLDSLQRGLTRLLTFLFLTKAASFAWDLGYVLVVSAVIGWQAWVHARSVTFGVCLMVILFLVFAVWGLLLTRTLPVLLRLQYGPPVFGALGGLPRRLFFLVVRCADAFKWAFAPEDLERVKTFGRIDRDVSEWSLKSAYHNVFAAKRPPELQDFEESWSHVWRENILDLEIQVGPNRFLKFEEALAEDNFGIRIEPVKLTVVSTILAPIVKMVQLVMICLLARFLDGKIHLLTVVQSGLFVSLIVCLILFLYHAHQNAVIPFVGSMVPNLPEQLKQQLKPFEGLTIRPKKVSVTKRYLTLIQNHFAEGLALLTFVNALSSLLIVSIVLLVTWVWHRDILAEVVPWYRELSVGLLFIPLGLLATYFVMFLVLRNVKLILAPLVVGLLMALLPYALTYLVGGRIDLSQVKNALVAVFMGLGTGLTTLVASRVKKIMENDGDSDAAEKKDPASTATG